jgi:pectin methylesterase-like acyl-CoA thioesterase
MIVSYDAFGNETKSWGPPKTERDGVWELGSAPGSGGDFGSGFRGGFPSELTADVTVCKDTSNGGCYKTVQEAVNTAPDNEWGHRYVIHIKEGVYNEIVRVPLEKKNVVFLGDGMGKTVITGSLAVGQPGISTYNTATVGKFIFNSCCFQVILCICWMLTHHAKCDDTWHAETAFTCSNNLFVAFMYIGLT